MAAAVLVAALQLILEPRRHVPRRPAMVRRATEPLTANILAAGRAGTGRQSCYSRLVAPAGGGSRSGSGTLDLLWSLLGEQSLLGQGRAECSVVVDQAS